MKLDDVPTVEWYSWESETIKGFNTCWASLAYANGFIYAGPTGAQLHEDGDEDDKVTAFDSANKAKRYVEIKIHCAAIERALIAELSGGK